MNTIKKIKQKLTADRLDKEIHNFNQRARSENQLSPKHKLEMHVVFRPSSLSERKRKAALGAQKLAAGLRKTSVKEL